jgi:magnesium-transporting ATPase (P-type)
MGSGCSSAKEACEMVLVDNNFSSVIAAVQWGRNIFQNCTKFLQFQLTVNLSLVLIIFIGIFFFSMPPMSAQMLLWINLIMDALAAIALGTEPPIANIVKGKPNEQTGLLKQKQVLRQIIGISIWNVLVMVLVFVFGGAAAGLEYDYFSKIDLTNPEDSTRCPEPRSMINAEILKNYTLGIKNNASAPAKPVYSEAC